MHIVIRAGMISVQAETGEGPNLLCLHGHVFFKFANDRLEGIAHQHTLAVLIHGFEKLQKVLDARRLNLRLVILDILRRGKRMSDAPDGRMP